MAYNKKDEDDATLVKVDRTSVFQEGKDTTLLNARTMEDLTSERHYSSSLQHLAGLATKMSNPVDKDCAASLHRREVSHERSDEPILRNQ